SKSNSTGILPILTKTTNTALGTSYLNLGIFSFVFTADFLYLAIALIIFGISEYYVKNSKFGILLFAVLILIGMITNLIPLFISLLTLIVIGAYAGIQYKEILSRG
ncbi:MAG: hypothetical protein ACP5L3_07690, partial [Caldisericum sp.]|uniref:hypothetical protein n=1 Tax=Caldisericum sp. TaxID=2499687 RepID=UPI003D09DDEB